MNNNSYATEVIEELSKNNATITFNEDKSSNNINEKSLLHCTCNEHTSETKLREGNKVFAVLIKENNKWKIQDTVCWQCSVRNIVERITENVPIAIVEGLLNKEDKDDVFCISEPYVWEIIQPN